MNEKYYYDYDNELKMRCVHVKQNDYLISLLSGSKHKFEANKNDC